MVYMHRRRDRGGEGGGGRGGSGVVGLGAWLCVGVWSTVTDEMFLIGIDSTIIRSIKEL